MPARDSSHEAVKQAVINDGWVITDDPYVISYGDRFLFIDLGASRLLVFVVEINALRLKLSNLKVNPRLLI